MPRTRKTVVILIAGKAGCGKTTISNMLVEDIQHIPDITFMQYSFSLPIKVMASKFVLWDGQKDEKGRQLLQKLGTVAREYNPDVLPSHLLSQMDKLAGLLPFNFVIVDDWRFPNELAFLKKNALLDVLTIRLFGRHTEMSTEAELDITENSLPEVSTENLVFQNSGLYDFTIDNSEDDLIYLRSKLDVILAQITKSFVLQ